MKLLKKIMETAAVIMAFSMLLCSCQSTKASDEIVQDNSTYSDLPAPVVSEKAEVEDEADYYEGEEETESSADDESKKKNNVFANLLISTNNAKFKEAGNLTFSTVALNGKLKQQDALYFVNTKNYNVGFGSPVLAAYYIIFMDQKTRSVFINAVNSYFSDFENKKLNRKDKKSVRRYGKSKVEMYWGLVKNQTTNNSVTDAFFGYTFKNKSPYFTITIYPAVNEKRKTDDSAPTESLNLNYYFTKAQCRELADFLSEENLYQYFSTLPKVEIVAPDEY